MPRPVYSSLCRIVIIPVRIDSKCQLIRSAFAQISSALNKILGGITPLQGDYFATKLTIFFGT